MDNLFSTTADALFKANQIVCLEHGNANLYGEVIQLIAHRGLCWFRPLCIVISEMEPNLRQEQPRLIDLQSGSDLLWPTILFRPAFDTEIINYLAQLKDTNQSLIDKSLNRQYLNKFVQQVWQANRDKF